MNALIILGLIFLAIYSCVSWLLPAVLAWLFKRKYHIKLKIGRIAVPKLILKDVNLSKDGYSVHINEVSFKSSFFNSEINKLVSVIIKDVEVNNGVEERRSVVVETILKPLLSKQNSATLRTDKDNAEVFNDLGENVNRNLMEMQKKLLDFRDKKLPPSLIMFAQFMGVHIFNASVIIQNGSSDNTWCLEASASEIHADGAAGGPAKALVFSANLVEAEARVVLRDGRKCLGEIGCSLLVEGTVKADGPLNVEKIHVAMSSPTIQFQDELYTFIQKQKRHRKQAVKPRFEHQDNMATIIPRFSPVIPKIFSLKIDTTSIICIETTTKTDFRVTLKSLQVNSRFSSSILDGRGQEKPGPQVYVAFQMDQLLLASSSQKMLYLDKLKLDAKLEKGVLNLYLILNILNISYNHAEVFRWYSVSQDLMRKTRPMVVQDDADTSALPRWLHTLAARCVVAGCAEVRNVRARLAAGGGAAAAAGALGLKLKLDQLLATRGEELYPYNTLSNITGNLTANLKLHKITGCSSHIN